MNTPTFEVEEKFKNQLENHDIANATLTYMEFHKKDLYNFFAGSGKRTQVGNQFEFAEYYNYFFIRCSEYIRKNRDRILNRELNYQDTYIDQISLPLGLYTMRGNSLFCRDFWNEYYPELNKDRISWSTDYEIDDTASLEIGLNLSQKGDTDSAIVAHKDTAYDEVSGTKKELEEIETSHIRAYVRQRKFSALAEIEKEIYTKEIGAVVL